MNGQEVKQLLFDKYGIDVKKDLEIIQDTDYNLSLKVQTDNFSYFVRLGKIIPRAEVEEEAFLLYDVKTDISIPKIIENKVGELVSVPGSYKSCVVFEFIEGLSFQDPSFPSPSYTQAFNAAVALAKLHRVVDTALYSREHRSLTSEIDDFLESGLNVLGEFVDELRNAKKRH